MKMKGFIMNIKVLIENTSSSDLTAEHGLSLFIQHNHKSYLLDGGQSGAFLENARKMNIPITGTDYCVLSHGHYDHAGGFLSYLKENPNGKIHAMKQAKADYYSGASGNIHEIGIPREILDNYESSFIFIKEINILDTGVYLIPHSTVGLEEIGKRTKLYKKQNGELLPDDFSHELSLVFDTTFGLIIFNSCSHGGIKNIIEEVKFALPEKEIYAFLGGLHMRGLSDGEEYCTFSEEEVKEIADYLKEVGIKKLYTGHCTGKPGFQLLKKYLGETVDTLTTGKEITL